MGSKSKKNEYDLSGVSMTTKLLCILHRAPPAHGAAKVGDDIANSIKLNDSFDCRFITIKSSTTISDIGKIHFKKIYYVLELYMKIFFALIIFRPDKIYYTASVRGVAFYRDLLISTLWKGYKKIKKTDIYYHYHTQGIDDFVSTSTTNLSLTRFFINNAKLMLLSPALRDDFKKIDSYEDILYLPNGVANTIANDRFESFIEEKYQHTTTVNVIFLSNMIKSKGYFHLLELAAQTTEENYHFHFAGAWQNRADEEEFFEFITQHNLSDTVTYHGFISGKKKQQLFETSHIFMLPTEYHNEAFPLTILESLSYGIPVIATNRASIPYILDEGCGVIVDQHSELLAALHHTSKTLTNKNTALLCRNRFLNNYSIEQFEDNLVALFEISANTTPGNIVKGLM